MKKPLLIVGTDTHLKNGNESQIIDIFKQMLDEAIKLGLSEVYFDGDWFDSRKYQSLSTLRATITILDMYEEAGVLLKAIPGNHDKPNYEAEDSYLDVFGRYKSLDLTTTTSYSDYGDVRIHMIPFFDEKTSFQKYLEESIKNIDNSKKNVLMTHVAVDGVRNNDGSEMEGVVGLSQFTDHFDLVLIGHYHDCQELADGKIIYIGSTHQHNFGENSAKGVTVLYDDLSIEQIQLKTKTFNAIQIDLNTVPEEEVKQLIEKYSNHDDNIRFKFTGTEEKLKAVDKSKFKKLGIDVKCSADAMDVDLSYTELIDFKGFDVATIIEEWKEFSGRKGVDEKMSAEGLERLKEVLTDKDAA